MTDESNRTVIGKAVDMALPIAILGLALLMIVMNILDLKNMIDTEEPVVSFAGLADAILIVGAIVIVADSRRTTIRSVGIYAVSLGLSRISTSIPDLVSDEVFKFASAVIVLILGVNLLLSGIAFLGNITTKRVTMMLSSGCLFVAYLFALTSLIVTGSSLPQIMQSNPALVFQCLIFLALIWMLDSDSVKYGSKLGRHVSSLDGINRTFRLRKETSITREQAAALTSSDGAGWTPVEDAPIESEYRFSIGGFRDTSYITVHRMKDSGKLNFTVSANTDGTMIQAERFTVNKIVLDSDVATAKRIELYGDDGFYASFSIRDVKEVF